MIVMVAAAAACGETPPAGPDGGARFQGGEVEAPGCGYAVRTGIGATAPEMGDGFMGTDPTPMHLHLGLAGDPRTSMVVTWRTADDTTRLTELWLDGVARRGLTWRYRDFDGRVHRMHEVHLCGLAPATAYAYRVGPIEATFRTAPEADDEIEALVLGDARGGADVFGALLATAETIAAPELILFTGDMVLNGARQEMWDLFFAAGEPLMRRVPIVAAIGNHEEGDIVYFSYLALPGDERRFGLDYGAAHLSVVDDTPWLSADVSGDGARFLAADLPAVPAERWRIVLHHQSIYSAGVGHGEQTNLRNTWVPLFDANAVDLVLSGHDHDYERSWPLRAGARQADGEGTVYVVTAGAGAPLIEAGAADWTAASASVHHFVLLKIRADRIEGRAFDAAGTQLDGFELARP